MDSKGYTITSLDSIWFVNVPLSEYNGIWRKLGLTPPLPTSQRDFDPKCSTVRGSAPIEIRGPYGR